MPFFSQIVFFLLNNKSSKLWASLTEHKEYSSITLRETPGTFWHQITTGSFVSSGVHAINSKTFVMQRHCIQNQIHNTALPPARPPTLWYIFFSCHLQKFRQRDVIVSVVFWQPVPVHTPNAINSFWAIPKPESHLASLLSRPLRESIWHSN